jgi:CubicO group peptidase (beta-lactamase class C family)
MSISAHDLARLGQLMLDGGRIKGQPVLAAGWTDRMAQACPIAPFYGRLVWRNHGGAYPFASPQSLFMQGAGGHVVWVEPAREAVVVFRWLDGAHHDAVMTAFAQALSALAAA